jgi:hypothetical protein
MALRSDVGIQGAAGGLAERRQRAEVSFRAKIPVPASGPPWAAVPRRGGIQFRAGFPPGAGDRRGGCMRLGGHVTHGRQARALTRRGERAPGIHRGCADRYAALRAGHW